MTGTKMNIWEVIILFSVCFLYGCEIFNKELKTNTHEEIHKINAHEMLNEDSPFPPQQTGNPLTKHKSLELNKSFIGSQAGLTAKKKKKKSNFCLLQPEHSMPIISPDTSLG